MTTNLQYRQENCRILRNKFPSISRAYRKHRSSQYKQEPRTMRSCMAICRAQNIIAYLYRNCLYVIPRAQHGVKCSKMENEA